MKKIILIALILAILFVSLTESKKKAKEQEVVQQDSQQQAKESKQTVKEPVKNEKDAETKQNTNQKQETQQQQQESLKEEKLAEKKRKADEKKLRQEQKQQEKLQREQQKLQEEEAKRVAKQQAKLEKEAKKQQEIANAQLLACGTGQFKSITQETGESNCTLCSQNCENCKSVELCNYCEKGFFRVVNKKTKTALCSSTIPKGYLPDISKFYKFNPNLQQQQSNSEQQGVNRTVAKAVHGKKPITQEPESLPFSIENGVAMSDNGKEKVRLDVVPCLSQCAECAEGYILNKQNMTCLYEKDCVFPDELIVSQDGTKLCKQDDQSTFRGKIIAKSKMEKVTADNNVFPAKKRVAFQAITNLLQNVGFSYSWKILDEQKQDITARVFTASGNLGKKVKATFQDFAAGSKFLIQCSVKEQQQQINQNEQQQIKENIIEFEHVLE